MNGFSVNHNNRDVSIALETGSVGIIISNKEGEFSIICNGMDRNGVYYEWHNEKLKLNDQIIIKYEHIDKSRVLSPILIRDVNNKEMENKFLLQSYLKLKQELLDEGLISM